MMERVYFKEYKGKSIYFVDYSDLKKDTDFLKVIERTNKFRRENIENKEFESQYLLVDFTGSFVVGSVFSRIKESGKATKPYLKKQAVLGVTGAKKTLLNLYNLVIDKGIRAFSEKEEALDWLVSD